MKKYKEKRPWGGFEQFTRNEKTTVKILTIKAGEKFSLQYHKKRREFWRFLDNAAIVTIGKKTKRIKGGDEVVVEEGTLHRIEALDKDVHVLEIAFGDFKEDDIVRINDIYGRT